MTGTGMEQLEDADPMGEESGDVRSEEEEVLLMSGGLGYQEEGAEEYRPLLREQESASPVYLPEGAGRGMVHDEPDDDEGVSFGAPAGSTPAQSDDDNEAAGMGSTCGSEPQIPSPRVLKKAASGERVEDDETSRSAPPASPQSRPLDEGDEGVSFTMPAIPRPRPRLLHRTEGVAEGEPMEVDDEAISFGPPAMPRPSLSSLRRTRGTNRVQRQLSDDDEAMSLGSPPTPRPPPVYLRRIEDDELAAQPPPTPRPATVSLNDVLHGEGSDAHFTRESAPEPPQLRDLDPMDVDGEEKLPPDFSLSPRFRIPPSRTVGAFVRNANASQHSEEAAIQEHDSDEDAEGEPDDEMFSRPTPIPGQSMEEEEGEVVPGSPAPTAMERVRNFPSMQLQYLQSSLLAGSVPMERSKRHSAPAELPQRRQGQEEPDSDDEKLADDEPNLPTTPIARDHVLSLMPFTCPPEYFRTSTIPGSPSSLLSDTPYPQLASAR